MKILENSFGKTSKLHLEASCKDGKTILSDVSFTAPFKVMHPFYEKKDRMSVTVLAASAGIMAGDRQELRFHVCEGAQMELTSQAYEKIHRMEEGYAARDTFIRVDERRFFLLYAASDDSFSGFRLPKQPGRRIGRGYVAVSFF